MGTKSVQIVVQGSAAQTVDIALDKVDFRSVLTQGIKNREAVTKAEIEAAFS
jgi:hypothetical protein